MATNIFKCAGTVTKSLYGASIGGSDKVLQILMRVNSTAPVDTSSEKGISVEAIAWNKLAELWSSKIRVGETITIRGEIREVTWTRKLVVTVSAINLGDTINIQPITVED